MAVVSGENGLRSDQNMKADFQVLNMIPGLPGAPIL